MTAPPRPDGCVLAGGAGRRFGSPKAGARLAGRTLVERAVDALLLHCERVVVVSRADVPLPPLPVPVVLDRAGPDCPLLAVASGLAALEADDVLVIGCDLPLAGALLDRLAAAPAGTAVAGARGGRVQPLCARYPRAAALAACDRLLASGALAARGLPLALGAIEVQADGDELLNVNVPADLARAAAILERAALS